MISNEVQVLQCRARLGALGPRRPPLVGTALQVIFLVITDGRWKQVVHYHEPDVLSTTLTGIIIIRLLRIAVTKATGYMNQEKIRIYKH